MSKRSFITTVTPLPAGITRETVLSTLHAHTEMIDLNPLVIERHPIRPPPAATAEEAHCQWYSITDKISYLPAGLYTGSLTFMGCFHDLPTGLQTHILAPLGLDMKAKWTLGGSLPGEPRQAQELGLGVPKQGLWLKEEVEIRCNVMATSFVKKTTKKAHDTLVGRLIEKSHIKEGEAYNQALNEQMSLRDGYPPDYHQQPHGPLSPAGMAATGPIRSNSHGVTTGSDTASLGSRVESLHSASPGQTGYRPAYTPPCSGPQQPPPQQYFTPQQSPGFPPDHKYEYTPAPQAQLPQHPATVYHDPAAFQRQSQQPRYQLVEQDAAAAAAYGQQHQQQQRVSGHEDASLYPPPLAHNQRMMGAGSHTQQQQQQHQPSQLNTSGESPMHFTAELPGSRTPVEMSGDSRHA